MKPEPTQIEQEAQPTIGTHNVDQGDYVATLATFAEWGDAKAQHNLAAIFLEGVEVAQDYAQALHWHTLAAKQNFALSQHDLGTMYLEGLGVAPDIGQAVYWFTKAAEQGDAKAQSNLGILYATGQGVDENVVEAAKWFHLSAASGLLDGVENLQIAKEEMTPEQATEAEKLAKEWSPKTEEAK
ncbi:MAG: sel1 repeat family protein [Magnetococcales bacterium]|nr:sel1 repeat family protein [Magnetococcales bacterium]